MSPEEQTYALVTVVRTTAIVCRLCSRISELPGDVEHRYCSRCHLFHESVAAGRRLLQAGGTHDCGEWRTFRGQCALCLKDLPPEAA